MRFLNFKFLKSFFQFLKILGKRYDIVFYYPQYFNRANGENPFFTDFISTCDTHSINYLLIEEPSIESNNPRNKKALAFDVFFLKIWVLRKVFPSQLFNNFEKRENFVGRLINLITFGSFKAPVYITISNSMGGVLRGINKNARIFDYQHGIINSRQPGYFSSHGATDLIKHNSKEILVHGPGFVKVFMLVDSNYYQDKVHPIGTSAINKDSISKGSRILIAMQIVETENRPQSWFQEQVDLLYYQFKIIEDSNNHKDLCILIKNHPRSKQSFDMSKLLSFPFVKLYDEKDSLQNIGLHVTFFSTTAFEFASKGIPTLFLYSDVIREGKTIFEDEYQYPFKTPRSILEWIEIISDSVAEKEVDRAIKDWYQKFYTSYDENLFLKLVNPKTL